MNTNMTRPCALDESSLKRVDRGNIKYFSSQSNEIYLN